MIGPFGVPLSKATLISANFHGPAEKRRGENFRSRAKRRNHIMKEKHHVSTALRFTGVSSLTPIRALSITSSNIANINTVGYKTSTADFRHSCRHRTRRRRLAVERAGEVAAASVAAGFAYLYELVDRSCGQRQWLFCRDRQSGQSCERGLHPRRRLHGRCQRLAQEFGRVLPRRLDSQSRRHHAGEPQLSGRDQSRQRQRHGGSHHDTDLESQSAPSATAVGGYVAGAMYAGTVRRNSSKTINVYDSRAARGRCSSPS